MVDKGVYIVDQTDHQPQHQTGKLQETNYKSGRMSTGKHLSSLHVE